MRRNVWVYVSMAVLTAASNLFAVESDTDGAKPGKWTMDLDAAKKVAAEKKLPILLDFSGSDWCGWCKLMEESVFTKPEWSAYATNSLMMVLIDFPNDKSLVPDKYIERNNALQKQYGIEGFPTFVILDNDGETELGRLGAGRNKTPESFQGELAVLFKNRPAAIAAYIASLSPEDQVAFKALNDKLSKAKADRKTAEAKVEAAQKQVEEIDASIGKLEDDLTEFRVAQLGEDKLKEYKDLQAQLKAKEKELDDWLATNPENNEENMTKFQAMQSELQELNSKLEAF